MKKFGVTQITNAGNVSTTVLMMNRDNLWIIKEICLFFSLINNQNYIFYLCVWKFTDQKNHWRNYLKFYKENFDWKLFKIMKIINLNEFCKNKVSKISMAIHEFRSVIFVILAVRFVCFRLFDAKFQCPNAEWKKFPFRNLNWKIEKFCKENF